jgi:hypothetical protein
MTQAAKATPLIGLKDWSRHWNVLAAVRTFKRGENSGSPFSFLLRPFYTNLTSTKRGERAWAQDPMTP